MRRVSNLAFNREFPAVSGLSGIPRDNRVELARDLHNAFDPEAVGVWLEGFPSIPLGWLYRKDSNRDALLRKLDEGGALTGHVEVQKRAGKAIKVVVFWL
ncbi:MULTISPECIES: hypothetical protein [Acidithiobacillaceae]|uniref:Uncharacterized protein n=1 Tax=Igneacidithiobacillus copahuensis TaxID=2724909 RepID=A0AAE2YR17_9PROT|nr:MULTISPECIES: hypothetical protein [Acidithiobacillaceae]MBU2763356.1 hypothetical protein [Acidithiobacillus caldus]MBU2771195.1 hypothetical protein [Acidithiobacillus caldus]MBU2788378.1 hypothetical protein [Igneacidithiobacillus copahuensis]MBU2796384.1 hypothetical protein [Acidithiobacillus sp. VAN18-2]